MGCHYRSFRCQLGKRNPCLKHSFRRAIPDDKRRSKRHIGLAVGMGSVAAAVGRVEVVWAMEAAD